MKKEPVSRILKPGPDIFTAEDNDNGDYVVGSLTALLKQVLPRNEEDLKAITQWIQAKKRLLTSDAALLETVDSNRQALLGEAEHLEQLRQQLLHTFVSQQATYQDLITAEKELAKRQQQSKEEPEIKVDSPSPPAPAAKTKKRPRTPRRR